MSTRFDAASDRVSFAGSMFAVGSGFTITAWAWVSVDTDANSTFARLHSSSGGSTVVTWATGSDGLSGPNYFTGGGSVTNATNMAVGAWRKIAISCSGTTGKSYVNTVGGTTEADSGTVAVGTPDGLTLGGRAPADSSEPFNGRLAYVRVWTTELTQVQIEAEWASTTPVITSGLWANWPLTDSADLTDHSGNGRNLTAGSTAVSTEADPPLGGSVTGTAAAAFGGLSGTATGTRRVIATAGLSGGGMSSAASGVRTVVGSVASSLGGMSGTAIAASQVTGTATGAFGGLHAMASISDPEPPPVGSWWPLAAMIQEAHDIDAQEAAGVPVSCASDYTPLREGRDGKLFCPWCGLAWPDDASAWGQFPGGQ